MEDQERSPEELPQEELRDPPTGRGLIFPHFNLGKTWHGPEEALVRFNDEVDTLADTYPDITDGYTTVRGNQLRIEDYRPYQAGPSQQDRSPRRYDGGRRQSGKTYPSSTRRHESYRESQQDQQDPDRRSY